jgi:hypothetical protein
LRITFVVAAYLVSTPLSSGFARLASGAFYFAILILTFYEFIKYDGFVKSLVLVMARIPAFAGRRSNLIFSGTYKNEIVSPPARNDSFLTYYEFIKYRGGKIPEDWPMSRARKQI